MGAQERYPSAEFIQTGFASLDRGPFARRSRAFFSGQGGQRRSRFFASSSLTVTSKDIRRRSSTFPSALLTCPIPDGRRDRQTVCRAGHLHEEGMGIERCWRLCMSRLRVSELVTLKQTDVDIHTGLVICYARSKERRVPIGKSAIHWLQQYLAVKAGFGKASSPIMFVNRGKPLTRQFAGHDQTACSQGGSQRYFAAYTAAQFCHALIAERRRFSFGPGPARV